MFDDPTILTAHTGFSQPRESLAVRFFDTLFDWMQRHQSRRALASMTDFQLHDVGLTRADIHREAGKPFWKQ